MSATASIPVVSQRRPTDPLTLIRELAAVCDPKAHAISYYCSAEPFAEKTHFEALAKIEHLQRHLAAVRSAGIGHRSLSEDLERVVRAGESGRMAGPRLRAIFACKNNHIWQELALPVTVSECQVSIEREFHLVPLLRAIQACALHCVVLIERGKARILMVRGQEIEELERPVPIADMRPQSAPGWSHHIEGNVQVRNKTFLKRLATEVQTTMDKRDCRHIIFGCREDVWAELAPCLDKAHLSSLTVGHFHLAGFEMTKATVLKEAVALISTERANVFMDFWRRVREEPRQFALGINSVLQELESGRVKTLLLGNLSNVMIYKCGSCAGWALESSDRCPICTRRDFHAIPAEEMILRKALATDTEILAPEQTVARRFGRVAATLRY